MLLIMNIWERRHQNVRYTEWMGDGSSNYFINAGCCIYHKPRDFGESSSSDENDDDDNKCDCHEHRVAKKKLKKR